jgi:[protein-PII] uridylyltransferase
VASSKYLEKVLRHAEERLKLRSGGKPSEILAFYKKFLKVEEHRLWMLHRAGGGGREVAQGRAQLLDVISAHVFKAAMENVQLQQGADAVSMTLVAVGGYGRGELCPHSDIDVMFLYELSAQSDHEQALVKSTVEQVLYMLWDIGFKVGHSTRTIEEAIRQANSDMQSKTALIESRFLCGDRALFERYQRALHKEAVKGFVDSYIQARVADQAARHEKHGDTVYLQEPNVKSGCGGLRDVHNLLWMAFFKYGVRTLKELRERHFLDAAELKQLENAYDFLLRVRTAMHYLTHRPCDVIGLGIQPQLATEFGYRHRDSLRRTEAFMRDYYTHARNIFLITNALAERMAFKPPKTGIGGLTKLLTRAQRKRETLDGFVIQNGVIDAASSDVFRRDPNRLMRLFLHVQQRGAQISPELRTLIRQNLRLINRSFCNAAEPRDTFLSILEKKGQVGRILRLMHETEVLGKYLPEFGNLTCLVQHEFYHRYTADEHTLVVIENLDKIIDAAEPPHVAYKKIFQQVERPHILYLALLLHDVGKAANVERHAQASVEMAQKAADRLKLPADEKEILLFLVRDHLKLAMLSQRRDLDDHATIVAAARLVQDPVRLDMLHLLTFADAAGTSLQTWTEWKDALLWEIYHRTREELTGPERAAGILARRIDALYRQVHEKMKTALPLEEIYSHFELMPASYYINTSAETIAHDLLLIHKFLSRQSAVEEPAEVLAPLVEWQHFPAQGYSVVRVCTWDRLGLFYKICGSLAMAEINILSAHIYTRGDHVVLDVFHVCDRHLGAVSDPKAIQTMETTLHDVLTGKQDLNFTELLTKMRATRRDISRISDVLIPTIIEFDNEISKDRTVIEIQTEDRLGLLYAMGRAMTELGLDISFAKATTEKGAAIDIFYVMDEHGKKIDDPARLEKIRERLRETIEMLASNSNG